MANTRLSPKLAHEILRLHMERQAPGRDPAPAKRAWRTRPLSYAPGESVLPADAQGSTLCLVVRGQLGVFAGNRRDGRPLVVLTPGRTFGRTTPRLSPSDATLKALTRCEVWFAEPVRQKEASGSRQPDGGAARRASPFVRLVPALVVVLLAALLVLAPSARAALAVLPMSLGDWCQQRGRAWCAQQSWSAAGLMAPLDASPSLAQGMLAVRQDNLEAAEAAFEKARAIDPGSPEAINNLGVVYHRRGEYERAAAAFRQALLMEPGNASAEKNLADSLLAIKAYDEALSHYRTALGLGGSRGPTLAGMAVAYYQTGRLPDAEQAARSALRARPDLPAAFLVLGAVALGSQQPQEALPLFRQAKQLQPEAGEVDYYLGMAYLALHQPADAEVAFRQALSLTDDAGVRAEIDRYLAALHSTVGEAAQP